MNYYITCILAWATIRVVWFIACAKGLDIGVQPEFSHPGDENVTFTCAGGNDKRTLDRILRMRLLRLDDFKQWTEVAVLEFDGTTGIADGKAAAVGHLRDVHDSYLTVTWPIAPDDINGRYRCDAVALTFEGDVFTVKSKELDVRSVSNNLSYILKRLMDTEKKMVTRVNQTILRTTEISKKNLLSLLNSNFDALKEYLDNKTTVNKRKPEKEVQIMNWPAGEFTLLMPRAGCPLQPPAWIKGFQKIVAFAGNKYYPMNTPLQTAIPHNKDGYIYRQFCTLPELAENTDPWPAGSYCLFTMTNSFCPTGFRYAEPKVKILSENGNFFLYYVPGKYTGVFLPVISRFCCRHDGNASSPIDLPISHPFYLFRHGGRCQEVKGMDVVQDIFMMETWGFKDFDKWIDNNTDFHPDVSFSPYKEDLCYYSRSVV